MQDDVERDLAKSIGRLLETFQTKLLARDFDALEALMTEDFTYTDADGSSMDRQTLLTRERRAAGSKPATEIQHELLSVDGDSQQAEAEVEMRFRTVIGSGISAVVYEGRGRERIFLRYDDSSWRFQKVVIEHQELTRNGAAAGMEAIEEMHRGK
ncbi:MAG: nuclear transport factor 2 family protein [Pseudomonadota bacterium]